MKRKRLLVGLGAPFYLSDDKELMVEAQTVSGLKGWHRNFDTVVAFSILSQGATPSGWVCASRVGLDKPEFEFIPLTDTYRAWPLSRKMRSVKETLLDAMKEADYCVFSFGGWLGDPGVIAADLARRKRIKHAVWLDRVESQVVLSENPSSWKSKLKACVIKVNEKRALSGATLSLLHGETVYSHFMHDAKNPHLAEDIHFGHGDRISKEELQEKVHSCCEEELRILYVGRASPMKGGMHWIRTLVELKRRDIAFKARWYGDGPDLAEMRESARLAGMSHEDVQFMGFISDREVIRAAYRWAHVFVFCHLTDESPRNLIESLHSATPLLGFDDPFARSLVNERGGGELVLRGDTQSLAEAVARIFHDRDRLLDLIKNAAASAEHLTWDRVFDARSHVVMRELGKE